MIEVTVNREPTVRKTTFGRLLIDGEPFCYTLEDEVREDPNPDTPHNEAKVHGQTAIPAGRYQLAIRNSPKFGPDTLWLLDVPGFTFVLIHSGSSIASTEGCIIVGDYVDREAMTIHGGTLRGVLAKLKAILVPAIKAGIPCYINVNDPGAA